jgi:hypothetical protein
MSRDGEPQDPWFEKFNARRDAMDKKLADSYRQLDDHNFPKTIDDLRLAMNKRFDELAQLINTQRHRSRPRTSRSSFRSNHVDDHAHHQQPQPQPQDHGANQQQQHIDSLCERKKPIPRKDERHLHIESKSDTPH